MKTTILLTLILAAALFGADANAQTTELSMPVAPAAPVITKKWLTLGSATSRTGDIADTLITVTDAQPIVTRIPGNRWEISFIKPIDKLPPFYEMGRAYFMPKDLGADAPMKSPVTSSLAIITASPSVRWIEGTMVIQTEKKGGATRTDDGREWRQWPMEGFQIGLRSDGVVVWREVKDAKGQP